MSIMQIFDRKILLTKNLPGNNLLSIKSETELQQKQITGTVTDKTGSPLPGVNIQVKGTILGAISDANGKYSIAVPNENAILVFSFIGYITQEMTVGTQTFIDMVLNESISSLDEIVIVGYSTQTRKSLTGSVATVNATSLSEGTSGNAITRLQGKASGITVIDRHIPGSDALITIRGLSTINNNNPLMVIDGVPTKSGMSMLNPNEIESVTILKDATSAAIYGARGASGVIIITTKRGSAGKSKVSFTARYGLSSFSNYYDLLNTQEYGELLWLEAKNKGISPVSPLYGSGPSPVIPDYIVPAGKFEGDPSTDPALYNFTPGASFYNITKANKVGTNWYDEILRTAPMQDYNLELSGGGEKGVYAFNVGYSTEEGVLLYTPYDRYSIRANSDSKMTKWLKVGESLGVTYSIAKGNRGNLGEGVPISLAYRTQPIQPVYDIMGNFAGTKGWGGGNGGNPVSVLYRAKDNYTKNLRAIGNIYGDIQFLKNLNFKSLFGFIWDTNEGKSISRSNPEYQEGSNIDALSISSNYTTQWNWTNTLSYTKEFGSHLVNVLIGSEALKTNDFSLSAGRSTYFSNNYDYMELNAGEKDMTNSGTSGETITASYFGRFNYAYMGKYLLEATFRRDGSSKFGGNSRWGNFPSASVGWIVSEEGFMDGIKDLVNSLKLRGGYGTSGNDEIGNYNGFTTFSSSIVNSFYPITGSATTPSPGFYLARRGNPNAKWETSSTLNIGIDVTVLNNTLTATVDIWQKTTKDMLYSVARPNVLGGATFPAINIGNMDNKGIDLNIHYTNKALNGKLTYNLDLILSHYKNKLVKISGNDLDFITQPIGNEFRQMQYTRAALGTSYPEFYGLVVDGFFQNSEEATSYPKQYSTYNKAGYFKWRDVNDDGVINDNDRTYIGNPHPIFTAGFNMGLGYKAFSLEAFFYSSYGNKLINYVKRWIDYPMFMGNRSKDRLYKSWGSPYLTSNADAILPLADDNTTSQYPSTAFVEDGSFLRLKTLQLSYTLPKNISQKLTIDNMQVYAQGTNIFTLTKYTGLDPEVTSTGINMGIDNGQWPTVKQIVFGIQLDF